MLPDEIIKSARIMIVDDEMASVRLLERMLERAGYRSVTSTTDARQAVGLFAATQPDLVLLDLHMPDIDGLEVLEALHEEIPSDSYVPIVILTGDNRSEMKLRALAAGAKDFLTKPFDQVEVMFRIRNLVEARFFFLRGYARAPLAEAGYGAGPEERLPGFFAGR